MYKLIGLIHFRSDLDHAEAVSHWRQQHGPLVSRIPGLVSYVQNFVLEGPPSRAVGQAANPGFDGYMWHLYPDKDAVDTASKSPEWGAVIADAATFIDQTASNMGPAEEALVADGARGSYKVAVLSAVSAGFKKPHTVPGVSRYVVNRLDFPGAEGGPGERILEEFWFFDGDEYRRIAATPEWSERLNGAAAHDIWSASVAELTVKG